MFLTAANTEKLTIKVKLVRKQRPNERTAMKQGLHSRNLADQAVFHERKVSNLSCIPFYVRVTSSVFHTVQHYFVVQHPYQNGFCIIIKLVEGRNKELEKECEGKK